MVLQTNLNGYYAEVTIASGAATSGAVTVTNIWIKSIAVAFPAAWTAADLKIQGRVNGTWYDIYDDIGNLVKITGIATAPSTPRIQLFPAEGWSVAGCDSIRVVSIDTSTEADVNQGASRTLQLIVMS